MGILSRLMILVLLVLVPSLGVQAVNGLLLYRDRDQEVRSLAKQSADIYNTELDQVATSLQKLLAAVAELPAVKSLDPATCGVTLRGLTKRYPQDVVLAVADLDGHLRCSSVSSPTPVFMGEQPFFAAAKQAFTVGTFTNSRLDGAPGLPFARPIIGKDGKPSGVIVACLSLQWLASDLQRPALQPGHSLTVTDRDGVVLAHLPEGEIAAGVKLPQRLLATIRAAGAGVEQQDNLLGRPTIFGYVPTTVPPRDIYLIYGIDREIAFGPIYAAAWRSAALSLVSILSALLIAWVVATRFIRRPVALLRATAQHWRDGNYAKHANVQSGATEIRELGAAFDSMIDALQARDKELAAALRFKDMILAAAGHDLRQPLQIVVWALAALSRRPLSAAEKEQVERADRAIDRLTDQLDTLIDLARLRDSTLQLKHESFEVRPFLDNLIDRWQSRAEAKRLRLRLQASDAAIVTDRRLLAVIVDNLVGNAIKYTSRGGVLVGCRRRADRLWIEIYDTGIGMSDGQVGHIFEEFRQLDPHREGFGLGLWIAHTAAKALGHDLLVRSTPGRGSCFRIAVPVAAAARLRVIAAAPGPASASQAEPSDTGPRLGGNLP